MIFLLILISLYIGLNFRYSLIPCIVASICLLVFLFIRYKRIKTLLGIVFIAIGVGISYINFSYTRNTYSGIVIESKENYFIFSSKLERTYVYQKDNPYEIGDVLTITGESGILSFSSIESSFNFEEYLNKKGVYKRLYPKDITINYSNIIRIRGFRKYFLDKYDDETANLINGILFSEVGDSETLSSYSSLHLTRLISTSGIFLYAFYAFFKLICSFFLKEKWADTASIGVLSIYGIFTFPKFSVLRFIVFKIFRWINSYLVKDPISYLNLLGICGIFFILIDYHLVYSTGYLLGFLIPLVSYFINASLFRYKKKEKKIFSVLLIYIYFIPFEVQFYHELNLISLPLQIVLSPLFISFGVSALLTFLFIPLYPVTTHIGYAITNLSYYTSHLKINLYAPEMSIYLIFLFNILFALFLYYLEVAYKSHIKLSGLFLSFLFLLTFVPYQNLFTSEVTFINVGQGDACLIRKRNSAVLIDTGGSLYQDIAAECLIPFFKSKQLYKIDLLITTHDDYDHSGAKESLMTNFKVTKSIDQPNEFPITVNGVTYTNYNSYFDTASEENEKSLVIGFSLANKSYLITGDAPISIEKKIITDCPSLRCNVLKVGHHGSDTSSSNLFISSLEPQEAIISVGKNNKYGHPSQSVIKTLKQHNVEIKRTDEIGSISYFSFG